MSYALTYPQLMNQALSRDLPETDLLQLRRGHEFVQAFADGIYRAQGVPLLNHLVRTASILLAERQPIEVVLGGMLHAVYILAYFDESTRQRPRQSHRTHVRNEFGAEVDKLIEEYRRISWYGADKINQHRQRLDDYPERMRSALILRLANDLEDSLDLALAYTGTDRAQRRLEACVGDSTALAQAMSLHKIAADLQACNEIQRARELPDFLVLDRRSGYELPRRRLWQSGLAERAVVKTMRRLKRPKKST